VCKQADIFVMGNVQVPTLSDTSSPLCITTPVLSKVPRLVLNTTRSPLRSCSSLPVPTCPPKRASSRACTATTTTSGTTTSTTMGTTRSWSSGSSPVSPSTPVVTREWMQISREFERTNGTLTVLVCTTFSTGVVNGRSVNSGASVGSPAPAGANPQPAAAEQAPSSSAAPAEQAPSSTAAAPAESSAAVEPGYQNGVALPTESAPTESAPAESAPASTSAAGEFQSLDDGPSLCYVLTFAYPYLVAAQKTCRVRTTQAQQKRKRAVQQARHQRRSRSGLGKKH
jgi:hypothetical protein